MSSHLALTPLGGGRKELHLKKVTVRCTVFEVLTIDTTAQSFTASVWIKATWEDERLALVDSIQYFEIADEKLKGAPDATAVGLVWSPQLSFPNILSCEDMVKTFSPAPETSGKDFYEKHVANGRIPRASVEYRFRGVFFTRMDLRSFPFDTQHLDIMLTSDAPFFKVSTHWTLAPGRNAPGSFWGHYAHTMAKIVPERHPSYPSIVRNSALSNQWFISPRMSFREDYTSLTNSGSGTSYSRLGAEIKITRRPGFMLVNGVFMLFLLVNFAGFQFAISPDDLSSRMSLVFTMVLTAVAYKYVLAVSLPSVSYLTFMDKYILLCIFMMLALVIEAVIAVSFPSIDIYSLQVFGGVWATIHLGLLIYVIDFHARHPSRKYLPLEKHLEQINDERNEEWSSWIEKHGEGSKKADEA